MSPDSMRVQLSLVVPILDEIENLEPLVAEIELVRPSIPGGSELILVDDGSRDGSWEKIRELASSRPWIRALRFLGNQGQTAAMAAGIDVARGELIAFMDGDLQNDPHDLPAMIAPIVEGRADVVCGWRAHRKDRTLSRIVPSVAANFLITHVLGLRLHDVGCTLKVFRAIYLESVQLYGEMHRFIPAYCAAQGARILEMPVSHRARRFGTSKYGLGRVYKVLIDLLTVKMLNTYGSKPAYFFGKIGFFFFFLGCTSFGFVAYRAFFLGRVESTPMIFFMLLMFVASLICLMSGLLAEINIRVLHKVGGKRHYRVIDEVGSPGSDR